MGNLSYLPSSSEGRKGWPWTEEVDPAIYKSLNQWPKISIITPSFNQGKFIEETIRSVLLQNYPNLEYIIVDGGSKDETIDVIKEYERDIFYWVSEPDNGQSHAINKGFCKATGDIIAWLNSDDYYQPLSLYYAALGLKERATGLIYGNAFYYHEEEERFSYINVVKKKSEFNLPFDVGLTQPATFWTRELWVKVGKLDEKLHYGFDWEWFLRATKVGNFIPCDKDLAVYRLHSVHKSGNGGKKRANELLSILEEHQFGGYVPLIKKIGSQKYFAKKVVKITSKYRVGRIFYEGIRFFDKDFRKFSVRELAELFSKAVGIYNY
jgi:glycosyltransferase involved in cell wall biosynthesis